MSEELFEVISVDEVGRIESKEIRGRGEERFSVPQRRLTLRETTTGRIVSNVRPLHGTGAVGEIGTLGTDGDFIRSSPA